MIEVPLCRTVPGSIWNNMSGNNNKSRKADEEIDMGTIGKSVAPWFAILVGVLTSASALAEDCFSLSPRAASDKAFESVQAHKLTSSERHQISTLFRKMAQQWEGDVHGYFCMGTENSPRKRPDNYQITVRVKRDSSSNIQLESTLFSPRKKMSRHENLRLFSSSGFLRVDVNRSSGDVDLVSLSDQHLEFIQAFRTRHSRPIKRNDDKKNEEITTLPANEEEASILPEADDDGKKDGDKQEKVHSRSFSVAREIVRKITISDTHLTIDYTVYTQGVLSSASTWQLKKTG